MDFDAVLLLSFGGPEGPEQVRPFLENVTRGRNVPPERLDEVAQHYLHFGGVSPINQINRALIARLQSELVDRGLDLPVYFGNRNWEPYVEDTVATMRDNGIRRAAVFATSLTPQGWSQQQPDTAIMTWPGSRDRVHRKSRGCSPMSATIFRRWPRQGARLSSSAR